MDMLKVCAFGEIMIRLVPPDKEVLSALPKNLEFSLGGAEANFLANISNLGGKVYFISALPNNSLGRSAIRQLDKFRINRKYVRLSNKGRMGIYFIEEGISNRPSSVIYDRKDSTVNLFKFEDFSFNKVFSKTDHFHLSGITPALSRNMLDCAMRSARLAKEMDLEVSCDLNYRSKLWDYKINGEKVDPESIMSEIAVYCDYLFGNETDIQQFFKIDLKKKEYEYEQDDLAYYENLLLSISKRFPHIKIIALSIRKSVNANRNYIGGILYIRQTNQFFFSPNIYNEFKPFLIDPIYDRIGSGDAFSSGFIVGLKRYNNAQLALDFAVASSVLKHNYRGDFSYASNEDIISLMHGDRFGRIKR